jgi:hypothetical protein
MGNARTARFSLEFIIVSKHWSFTVQLRVHESVNATDDVQERRPIGAYLLEAGKIS